MTDMTETKDLKPCPICGFRPTQPDAIYHVGLYPCPADQRLIPEHIWNAAYCWKELDKAFSIAERLAKETAELKDMQSIYKAELEHANEQLVELKAESKEVVIFGIGLIIFSALLSLWHYLKILAGK